MQDNLKFVTHNLLVESASVCVKLAPCVDLSFSPCPERQRASASPRCFWPSSPSQYFFQLLCQSSWDTIAFARIILQAFQEVFLVDLVVELWVVMKIKKGKWSIWTKGKWRNWQSFIFLNNRIWLSPFLEGFCHPRNFLKTSKRHGHTDFICQ